MWRDYDRDGKNMLLEILAKKLPTVNIETETDNCQKETYV